jgi:hypothetical protein
VPRALGRTVRVTMLVAWVGPDGSGPAGSTRNVLMAEAARLFAAGDAKPHAAPIEAATVQPAEQAARTEPPAAREDVAPAEPGPEA